MHVMVLDGVYVRDADHGVVFHTAPPPTLVELEAIVRRVRDRALQWLRRRGLLDERPLEERSNEAPELAALDGCAAIAMYRGTLAMLPASEDEADCSSSDADGVGAARSAFAVERDGFNLHAGVWIEAGDDLGRERLCRYGARPPLSLERLRRLPGGRVAYRVKIREPRAREASRDDIDRAARTALGAPPASPLSAHSLPRRARAALDVAPRGRPASAGKLGGSHRRDGSEPSLRTRGQRTRPTREQGDEGPHPDRRRR